MNPLAAIIALFAQMKIDLAARFNTALATRPPLESVEGANVANGLLREFDWAQQRLERMGTELNANLAAAASIIPGFEFKSGEPVEVAAARLIESIKDDAAAKAISGAIAAKTHLPIEDHTAALDNAVLAAKNETRTELEGEFATRLDEVKLIATRRSAAIEKVGAVAAGSLTDADLLAENHEALLAAIEGRVSRLAEVGVTAEAKPKSFTSLMACGTDEAGNTEFEARLETIKEATGPVPLAAAAPVTPKASTPAGFVASGDSEKKKTII